MAAGKAAPAALPAGLETESTVAATASGGAEPDVGAARGSCSIMSLMDVLQSSHRPMSCAW